MTYSSLLFLRHTFIIAYEIFLHINNSSSTSGEDNSEMSSAIISYMWITYRLPILSVIVTDFRIISIITSDMARRIGICKVIITSDICANDTDDDDWISKHWQLVKLVRPNAYPRPISRPSRFKRETSLNLRNDALPRSHVELFSITQCDNVANVRVLTVVHVFPFTFVSGWSRSGEGDRGEIHRLYGTKLALPRFELYDPVPFPFVGSRESWRKRSTRWFR